jgi:hypothetical protein
VLIMHALCISWIIQYHDTLRQLLVSIILNDLKVNSLDPRPLHISCCHPLNLCAWMTMAWLP